jgi:protein TonB
MLKPTCLLLLGFSLCSCVTDLPSSAHSTSAIPIQNDENSQELARRSIEIAKLEAETNRNNSVFAKKTRRKFIGTRVQEYRYELYAENWNAKIEHIGNLNYPEVARRQKIFGKITPTVCLLPDGSIESIQIIKPSGIPILDEAVIRIVRLASPYATFPPDIRKETDILCITRTWTFTTQDRLESE